MPRYLVERSFPDAMDASVGAPGTPVCGEVVERNGDHGVTWLHSYVTLDKRSSVCVYDAPSPEAIRKAAARNAMPVDRITQVTVFEPCSYR